MFKEMSKFANLLLTI